MIRPLVFLFIGFERREVESPALHFARKILVTARVADMEIPVIGSISPARIIYDPTYIARESFRHLTAFTVAKNLFYLFDEFSVYSIFLHIPWVYICKNSIYRLCFNEKRKKFTFPALGSSTVGNHRKFRCRSRLQS